MFEAVGRTLLVSVGGFVPLLAEEEHLVIQEQVPLHGFEPGQVLHLKPEKPELPLRSWAASSQTQTGLISGFMG